MMNVPIEVLLLLIVNVPRGTPVAGTGRKRGAPTCYNGGKRAAMKSNQFRRSAKYGDAERQMAQQRAGCGEFNYHDDSEPTQALRAACFHGSRVSFHS